MKTYTACSLLLHSLGTREQAYVYGLAAAAIAHSVSKACSSGHLSYCPCGPLPNDVPSDFRWTGCSDNVQYGVRVSEEWADAPWRRKKRRVARDLSRLGGMLRNSRFAGKHRGAGGAALANQANFLNTLTPRARMNQHNNDVGRTVLSHSLELKCKCHGVSGSCATKTCWQVVPPLAKIGQVLKEKYNRATEVRARSHNTAKTEFEPVALISRVTADGFVFMRKSPDYCTEDGRVGSSGTKGRYCNASENTHAGCDSMCCGRGYETYEIEVISNCECRYVHCCRVECKQCREMVKKHYCK